ncbi:MAG: type III-B CRISPR module-associated protein Cmr5 [candidate division WOR-3 bacterium]
MTEINKTLNQERANYILKKVKEIKNKEKEEQKKFKTNARRVSSLIISNGLLPTLAFLKSKKEKKPVYDVFNEWLKERKFCQNDALEELLNSDASKLRLATMEVLELANWLGRIVEIEIEDRE